MSKTIQKLPRVKARVGHGKTWIYEQIKKGTFPQAIRIGERSVGWLEEEIDQWIDARVAETRGDAA